MTGLRMWLAGILNAYVERHNVPAAEPFELDWSQAVLTPGLLLDRVDSTRRHVATTADVAVPCVELPAAAVRPCWACGDPAGFHAEHQCDSHFDTTGGAPRRPMPAPSPPPIRVVGVDYGFPSASTWRRT